MQNSAQMELRPPKLSAPIPSVFIRGCKHTSHTGTALAPARNKPRHFLPCVPCLPWFKKHRAMQDSAQMELRPPALSAPIPSVFIHVHPWFQTQLLHRNGNRTSSQEPRHFLPCVPCLPWFKKHRAMQDSAQMELRPPKLSAPIPSVVSNTITEPSAHRLPLNAQTLKHACHSRCLPRTSLTSDVTVARPVCLPRHGLPQWQGPNQLP